MIFLDWVRHDATFPVYGVAVGRMQWPDRYLPALRGRDQTPGECLLVRRVTLLVCEPLSDGGPLSAVLSVSQ
jgi:hypothetical protein